jgi:hypothetical protein
VSTEGRDAAIRELSRQGRSVRQIARELGVSKSQVHRVLIASPLSTVVGADDTDPDPWTDTTNGDALALFDTAEERWPAEPFTLVGTERQWFTRGPGNGGYWADRERWVDGDGRSVGDEHESAEMALYRYRNHVAEEPGDYERADALASDWQRQRDEARTAL